MPRRKIILNSRMQEFPVKRTKRPLTKPQAAAVKKIVHGEAETKYIYARTGETTLNIAPLINAMAVTTIPIGDSGVTATRSGNEVTSKRINVRFLLYKVANTQGYGLVRLILFQYYIEAVPVAADILVFGAGGSTIDYSSQYNILNKKNYGIIMDRTYKLIGGSAADFYPPQDTYVQIVNKSFSLKRKTLKFTATDGTVGFNKLYYMIMTNINGNAQFHTTSLHFYDDI